MDHSRTQWCACQDLELLAHLVVVSLWNFLCGLSKSLLFLQGNEGSSSLCQQNEQFLCVKEHFLILQDALPPCFHLWSFVQRHFYPEIKGYTLYRSKVSPSLTEQTILHACTSPFHQVDCWPQASILQAICCICLSYIRSHGNIILRDACSSLVFPPSPWSSARTLPLGNQILQCFQILMWWRKWTLHPPGDPLKWLAFPLVTLLMGFSVLRFSPSVLVKAQDHHLIHAEWPYALGLHTWEWGILCFVCNAFHFWFCKWMVCSLNDSQALSCWIMPNGFPCLMSSSFMHHTHKCLLWMIPVLLEARRVYCTDSCVLLVWFSSPWCCCLAWSSFRWLPNDALQLLWKNVPFGPASQSTE